ncbi:hypothetical protein AMAG_19910 [Allomyces macrogynus ATCC 38327]|uniref:Response regulatory domain-containing protein n=1 Tax=Allomyces macrogynus (strain ATCC 38327) TaxID=578462 RepID=A0A0L0T3P8_ALLM3|nr:hypothetical protein AMAG_19910 [Allomyces macrogynus ATCC 38327]|eukprot:KNE69320.1 hypothetical protein AMAG_19910 [Allomyces macrogynus ATCC 38327]
MTQPSSAQCSKTCRWPEPVAVVVSVSPAASAPVSPEVPPAASPVAAPAAPTAAPAAVPTTSTAQPAAAAAQPAAPAAPAPGAAAPAVLPRHVLLVEDNLIVQRTTARMIAMGGHRVTTAGNGQIAVNLMADPARATDPVHFIFMDLQMPVMDGTEAASIIATQLAPDVPIVAFTANATEDERVATMATGHFRACLFKPAKRDSLLETVAQWTTASE